MSPTFRVQWIELLGWDDSLEKQLNDTQQRNPQARLVSVMCMPRNLGACPTYRAIWANGDNPSDDPPAADGEAG